MASDSDWNINLVPLKQEEKWEDPQRRQTCTTAATTDKTSATESYFSNKSYFSLKTVISFKRWLKQVPCVKCFGPWTIFISNSAQVCTSTEVTSLLTMSVLGMMKCKMSSVPKNPREERDNPLTVIHAVSQVDPNIPGHKPAPPTCRYFIVWYDVNCSFIPWKPQASLCVTARTRLENPVERLTNHVPFAVLVLD